MLFLGRIGRLGLNAAASTVLGLMVLGGAAVAQDQGQAQPKTPAPQAAPAGEAAPPPPGWVVNCTSVQTGLDCRAGQSLFIKETGQRLLSVALRVPPDTKKPTLLMQVPLGIYLPAGVALQFGKDTARKIVLQSCDQNGCLAEYAITDAEIGAMLKGADLTITIQNLKQEPVAVQVPVLGFPAAYAKIK